MACKMVSCEILDQIQFVILVYQKLLTSLSLLEGVVVLSKASIDSMLFELLHTLGLQMSKYTFI